MNQKARRSVRPNATADLLNIDLHRDRFPLKVLLACFSIEVLLYVLDYFLNYGRAIDIGPFRRLFSTTIESSFPSFFSIGQTLLVAVTLWIIVQLVRTRGDSRWVVAGWVVLAAFFTYMAIDDGAKFHERMGTALGTLREKGGGSIPFPSYNWQFFFLPFFATMGLFTMGFGWFRMKDRLSRILIVVAILMLVIAVGIDFVEGLNEHHPWNLYRGISDRYDLHDYCMERFEQSGYKTVQHFFKSAEELFFEAGANSVLWFLFLRYLLRITGELRIRARGPESSA